MLVLFVAATATPMPPSEHDAYDWFSDIWLPAGVGIGSLLIAGLAVAVAARSNRLARAATQAAERSNALARLALAHEREQAKEALSRIERERRAAFSDRVLAQYDLYLDQLEETSVEARRSLASIGSLDMEVVSNGWEELELNEWAGWALEVKADDADEHGMKLRQVKHALHAVMSAWVRDPSRVEKVAAHFDTWLKKQ